jgi:hypothetical protein
MTIADLISSRSAILNDFILGAALGGNSDIILFSEGIR